MILSPPSCSSSKLSAMCTLQRSTSSLPFDVKNVTTGQLLSTRLSKYPQISLSTKLRCPVFSYSNFRWNGHINKHNTTRIQDSGGAEPDKSNTMLEKMFPSGDVVWKFMTPFVVRENILAYIAVFARTWMEQPRPLGWSHLLKALGGLVAVVCYSGYTSGINQIFDVEIDRINKPYFPIPSGEMSIGQAWLVITIFVAMAIIIVRVLNYGPFTSLICCQYLLGTIYSVPPFSLKRSTLGAILVMALGQGCVLTLAQSSAARASLGLPFALSPHIIFLAGFTTLYSSAISILKDVSDVEGDKQNNVPTLATIVGSRNVTFIGCGLLFLNYMGAILAAIFMPQIFRRNIMIPAHTILALFLIFLTWKVDKANYGKEESKGFYRNLWKLLGVEYALFPFI